MVTPWIARLADGVTGAACASALAALAVTEWRGFLVAGIAGVIAQALRIEV